MSERVFRIVSFVVIVFIGVCAFRLGVSLGG